MSKAPSKFGPNNASASAAGTAMFPSKRESISTRGVYVYSEGGDVSGRRPAILPNMDQATDKASVIDVAQYILNKMGPLSAMKLQKLVYYCQAWHIVWHDNVMFPERIEAWADGPVAPDLFRKHQGQFRVSTISGANVKRLDDKDKNSIDKVIDFYGDRSSQWLSDLTHQEDPWLHARAGLPERAPSTKLITPEALGSYYSSL